MMSALVQMVRPLSRQFSADCSVALCVMLDSRAVQASPYSVEQYVRMRLEPEIRNAVERLESALCRSQMEL